MKKVIKHILDFTVILSILLLIGFVCYTIYGMVSAYQEYSYCAGFFCEEVRYYYGWEGVLAFFRDQFFFVSFVLSIIGVLPLICLPVFTFINLKILNKTNKKWYLIIPVIIFVVSSILGSFYGLFKFLSLFVAIYGGTFIISYLVAFLYNKVFCNKN